MNGELGVKAIGMSIHSNFSCALCLQTDFSSRQPPAKKVV